jgi:hypothetical protein
MKYFKDLLATLKSIDESLKKIEKNSEKVAECVKTSSRGFGDKTSLSTKHWNHS